MTRRRGRGGATRVVALAILCVACGTPPALTAISRSHPGASYEAQTSGCGTRVPVARRFGRDLRAAVLWGRVVTDSARLVPCEVVVHALQGDSRQPVYRILRRTGYREERVLTP